MTERDNKGKNIKFKYGVSCEDYIEYWCLSTGGMILAGKA
jgi:hypothetical protein